MNKRILLCIVMSMSTTQLMPMTTVKSFFTKHTPTYQQLLSTIKKAPQAALQIARNHKVLSTAAALAVITCAIPQTRRALKRCIISCNEYITHTRQGHLLDTWLLGRARKSSTAGTLLPPAAANARSEDKGQTPSELPAHSGCQQTTSTPQPYIPTPSWLPGASSHIPEHWWSCGPTINPRKNFFYDIMGIDETTFRQICQWNPSNPFTPDNLGMPLQDWIAQYPRRAALFSGICNGTTGIYTVGNLLDRIKTQARSTIVRPYFTVLVYDPTLAWENDIRYLQSVPGNKQAVFQIASTFFGPLEGGMASADSFLGNMFPHAAQGEEASVATAGGTLWRKYMMGRPYYLLEFLQTRLPVFTDSKGRYALDRNGLTRYRLQENDPKSVSVFIQDDVVVTSGYGSDDGREGGEGVQQQLPVTTLPGSIQIDTRTTQVVTQVFTSAINVKRYWDQQGRTISGNIKEAAQMALDASYQGTLAAAVHAHKPRIFLTLMGGGAFANDISWISQAITRDQNCSLIKTFGLQPTVLYSPDKIRQHSRYTRTAQTDKQLFDSLLIFFDNINDTHLAHDQRVNECIAQYLTQSYAFVANPQNDALKESVHKLAQALNHVFMLPVTVFQKPLEQSPEFQEALQKIYALHE